MEINDPCDKLKLDDLFFNFSKALGLSATMFWWDRQAQVWICFVLLLLLLLFIGFFLSSWDSIRVSLVRLFEKVHNEKVEFQKVECLVKTIKKCIMKKLSVWLVLIKVAFWGVNDQKGQCIYKGIYFILFFFFSEGSELNDVYANR